jgi:hypothetical protein
VERERQSGARGWVRALALALIVVAGAAGESAGDRLQGSRASLARQVGSIFENDFTLLETGEDVRRFVSLGLLVPVRGNRDYRVRGASFRVARPEVKTFVERLASQYRRACGEPLVVTSLTRPKSHQPQNAYRRSAHRAGIAVDIRRSGRPRCRRWLEETLRTLEAKGVLEATRERHPAHYHVAVFPKRYTIYVAKLTAGRGSPVVTRYEVQPGDTLWNVARTHGTTVRRLREVNALDEVGIVPGQTLLLPRDL